MSEFKVGDRVRIVNEDICGKNRIGKICKKFLNYGNINRNLYEVDVGATYPYEIFEEDLELYEEKEVISEFIPNDRLETKVEVKTKTEIKIEQLEQRIEKLEKEVFKPVEIHDKPKETKPSLLTEDERVILRNLEDDYKWIVRDETGWLTIHEMYPYINNHHNWVSNGDSNFFDLFNHIFQFIKWGDKPYNIEELLKGECGNE